MLRDLRCSCKDNMIVLKVGIVTQHNFLVLIWKSTCDMYRFVIQWISTQNNLICGKNQRILYGLSVSRSEKISQKKNWINIKLFKVDLCSGVIDTSGYSR